MVSASTSWNRYLQSYIAVYSPPFSQNVMLQHHLRLKARGPLRLLPSLPCSRFRATFTMRMRTRNTMPTAAGRFT
jgi:hypothetical protein